MKLSLSNHELQLRHFWRITNAGIANVSLFEYQDELEVLGMMAESPALKRACAAAMHRFDHLGTTRIVAVAR